MTRINDIRAILQVKGVSKHFGGLVAVNNVTFDLPEGQILGLIGPNGAGKTTLFNVINGVYPATEGRYSFRGKDVTGSKTYQMAHLGLARTHQVVKPLDELTVRENAMVGACFGSKDYNLSNAARVADEVLEFVGLIDRAEQPAGSLNVAQKKRLEMARALSAQPYLLLLDEALAGLNPSEIDAMLETIREIRDRGITIVMIEHVMHAIMNVSDRILVLSFGKLIAEGTPEEIANNDLVIKAYLGDPKLAERLMQQNGNGE
ncbi:MAG: ABC transporter ATP-binding protein [Chloroflexi bacterium]|nr:MAG: ABC transporter ATP-binding protein [Chloroflexota bacterium]RLC88330.1 MAG: ABC transporter ATP-binding protein [Chloroflexota bacterium]